MFQHANELIHSINEAGVPENIEEPEEEINEDLEYESDEDAMEE